MILIKTKLSHGENSILETQFLRNNFLTPEQYLDSSIKIMIGKYLRKN
jgi:hypothetical protein